MYGVCGRSRIALGHPVGASDAAVQVAWQFKEQADAHGAPAVFYEVSGSRLPLYVDLGLSLLKLGEEAIVHTSTFSLEHPSAR
jgi:phosphatidylglycerol lysyltransferase